MNKLLLIFGFGILSSAPLLEEQKNQSALQIIDNPQPTEHSLKVLDIAAVATANEPWLINEVNGSTEMYQVLESREIHFLEIEEDIVLGFDTSTYLPSGFNPYVKGFDMTLVAFMDEGMEPALNFDTTEFLAEDFNAYTDEIAIETIQFMEDEEVELGFETAPYLPEGYDPYKMYFDISKISFLEEPLEYQIDLGSYLPKDFNPFPEMVNFDSIDFMEVEEIEIEFNTADYLPEGFDPYKRSM